MLWLTEKTPRQNWLNVAQNGCEKTSSVCRTLLRALDSYPFDPASPLCALYSQPYQHLTNLLQTSTRHTLQGRNKLTSSLQERVFSKTKSIRAPVPLNKRFTFIRKPETEKQGEVLKAKAAEMEQTAFKAVIDLVEVSKLVELSELLEHRVV